MKSNKCQMPLYIDEKSIKLKKNQRNINIINCYFISSDKNGTYEEKDFPTEYI